MVPDEALMREALRLAREAAARREVPVGAVVVRSGRGNKDRVMLLPKIRYRGPGPFYVLLGHLYIDSASPIANVQRSLGLVDEHDVDLDSSIIYAATKAWPT
jgi:hypothetical protein